MDPLTTSNIVTIAGWVVGPIVGTAIALISRRRSERLERVLAWAVITEADIIKKEIGQSLPVKVSVGGKEEDSLSILRVQLGSSGYKAIEAAKIVLRFGPDARLVHSKIVPNPSKEFQKKVTVDSGVEDGEHVCTVGVPFLNLGQSVTVEFMVAAYRAGDVRVDVAEKGVEVQKTTPTRFEAGLLLPGKPAALFWQALGFSYDETPPILRQIVEELREMRHSLSRRDRHPQTTSVEILPQNSAVSPATKEKVAS